NGEYFAVARRDRFYGDDARNKLRVDETMVFTKEGELHKKYSGAAIKWSPDSNSILLIFGDDEFRLQNIKTGHLVKFQPTFIGTYDAYRESFVVDFVPATGNLIYYRLNEIFEYDFNTNKSSLIYTTPSGNLHDLKYITKDILFFRLSKKGKFSLYIYELHKYDFKNKTLKKIFPHGISRVYYFMPKSNRLIIYFDSGVNEYSYFIDENGKNLFKIDGLIFDTPENRSDEYLNLDYTSFAPNGKLFAATIGEFTEVYDEVITADVYLFNLSGKMEKLTKTDDRMELVCGWSPQGNKLVYFENKEKKYYLLTLTVDK
ncbi:MAG: hypothetical protein PVH61_44240, partial [Candidatus Aminicenantes bacterium]